MLALGVSAQAAGSLFLSTPAYLIPLLHLDRGVPLAQAGLLAAAPSVGMVMALVAWGAVTDRYGERWVIAGGLALTAVFAFAAAAVPGYVGLGILFVLGGAAAASTSAASGRVVIGWFPRSRRGLAMGIRQISQPLGVAVAALAVPPLASGLGIWAPLLLAGALTAVLAAACAVGIANPPRSAARPAADGERPFNPYREGLFLTRIHLLSALLVVPQFTLSTFGLIWLITGLRWNVTAAGAVIAAAQFIGALGRIAVGSVSDRVGSRTRVLRWVAVSGVVVMLAPGGLRRAALGRRLGGGADRRVDRERGRQRPVLHQRRRGGRAVLVGQGPRHPEHRPVHRRLGRRPRHRRAHHRRRLPGRLRPRRSRSAGRRPARSGPR